MSSMRNSYASQLDSLQKAISEMQQKISNLADERDSELTSMEEKLDQIDHNIYELERAPQGESNGKKIPAVTVLSK